LSKNKRSKKRFFAVYAQNNSRIYANSPMLARRLQNGNLRTYLPHTGTPLFILGSEGWETHTTRVDIGLPHKQAFFQFGTEKI
jgi:hypothetical protein